MTRSFDVFFDLRLNKRLSEQSRRRWFETPSRSWWCHCNVKNWNRNTDTFFYLFAHSPNACMLRAHPVQSDFRLSKPVDCYVDNLENGVILSYINDEIKIVAIQKSVLYNDGNLVIILSAFFSPENERRKKISRFCKRYLQYYMIASQARFLSFGHSHWTISVYIRWHCRWLNLCLGRLFSFLGYWLSYNFIHVHQIFWKSNEKFRGMASDTRLVETTRRPRIACDARLIMTNYVFTW